MSMQVIVPRIRGFICLNANPLGCAVNVEQQVDLMTRGAPGHGLNHALVIGSSTGYGLSSLLATVFGYGARAVGVCWERPAAGQKSASAGWYNLATAHRLARAAGRPITTINGDAFSDEVKQQTIAALKDRKAKLDCIVYSLASPKRVDPRSGATYFSVLKPIGQSYHIKSINLTTDELTSVDLSPATEDDIQSTRKVMGGEDWELWMRALIDADLIAPACRTVAYSYVGPQLTYPIYRSGTIGKAKEHLEETAQTLDRTMRERFGGGAYISINKALVTQASSAIPVVPLYISILYKVMKAKGTHEGTAAQILRMFEDHLGPGRTPVLDAAGRIRLDDRELAPDVQSAALALWEQVTTENLFTLTDYAGFKQEFRSLFGFDMPGIDYAQPVETEASLDG